MLSMLIQLTTSLVRFGQTFEAGELINLPTAEALRFLERNMAAAVAPVVDTGPTLAFDCPHCAGRCQVRQSNPTEAATIAAAATATQSPTERAEHAGNETRRRTARAH